MNLLERLFGIHKAAGTGQLETDHDPAMQDPRIEKAIAALMENVHLLPEGRRVDGTGSEGPVMAAANLFKTLHDAHPGSALLHYSWAAALQVALQGETAAMMLDQCVENHPTFWLAAETRRQHALLNWNPFFLPELDPTSRSVVHPVIEWTVSTNVLLATRQDLAPRAVVFLRDRANELPPSTLDGCRMEFVTTISEVTDPQVVAINGRIHDDPSNPYQCEVLFCPVLPFGHPERLPWELLARQAWFDFVVLDGGGRIKWARRIEVSSRSREAHAKLAEILETTEGPEISNTTLTNAIERHQAKFDPAKIQY